MPQHRDHVKGKRKRERGRKKGREGGNQKVPGMK
jgi:hypothetical protein